VELNNRTGEREGLTEGTEAAGGSSLGGDAEEREHEKKEMFTFAAGRSENRGREKSGWKTYRPAEKRIPREKRW